jgi:IclR family transcriptional regulator, pca regulon regulatory protein
MSNRNSPKKPSDPEAAPEDSPLFIGAVARAFSVLECFTGMPEARSLAQLAELTGLDRSAVQRIAFTLSALGYLERTPQGLVPGSRLLDRACDYLRGNALIQFATPVMIDLRRSSGERVDFSIFDDLSMLFAIRLQSKRETFIATLVGRRVPTFCSSGGRAVMAKLDDASAKDLIRRSERKKYTAKTLVNSDDLWQRITIDRKRGYAAAIEELLPGEISIGAAVTERGKPIAAIHVSGSLSEWSVRDFESQMGPLITAAAAALSN